MKLGMRGLQMLQIQEGKTVKERIARMRVEVKVMKMAVALMAGALGIGCASSSASSPAASPARSGPLPSEIAQMQQVEAARKELEASIDDCVVARAMLIAIQTDSAGEAIKGAAQACHVPVKDVIRRLVAKGVVSGVKPSDLHD